MYKAIRFSILSFILLFIGVQSLWATHNRAGEITYQQIGLTSIRCTVTTYTKASSVPADRDSLEICWGDGKCEWVRRVNGSLGPGGIPVGEFLPNDTKRNLYVSEHTYPSLGHFVISMTDPNRNGGILNVNAPNSDNVPFHIQTTLTLFNQQFKGDNNSPILQQPPIDIGCVGQPFEHNPNAFEPDGDSLSYHLVIPLQDVNTEVPNYKWPYEIEPGPDNELTLDPVTGDLVWDAPQRAGEYNIAIRIIEYRDGIPIDTLLRDMQILVKDCDNLPPVVQAPSEICVVAGEVIEFVVTATDPDVDPFQQVELTALGGPFVVPFSPATFSAPGGFNNHPVLGTFRWQTTCEHISRQPYTVVFKAVDDHPVPLTDLKTLLIKVVGPPPEDVQAAAESSTIEVSWELPYVCEDAAEEYFRGFSVWRRQGPNPFPADTCNPGIDGQGYQRLAIDFLDIKDGRYAYIDNDVERGRTYCYRILGEFAKLSAGGFEFNRVQSLRSEEVCIQLSRDIPLITNVDVLTTDPQDGRIFIRWSKPVAEDLDTLQNPGPYRYQLRRATGFTDNGFTPIPGADWSSPTFSGANDTIYIDSTGLNTQDNPYTYQLAFFVAGESEPLGTIDASSVFLSSEPTDNTNILTWEADVPWDNFLHTIFRKLPGSATFDSLTTVSSPTYRDEGLTNGLEYCYYVKTIGSYGIEGIDSLLFNRSQELCSVPIDNVPPCPPVLRVSNDCPTASDNALEEFFINRLGWDNPNDLCEETDDVVGYNVYYSPVEGGTFEIIERINYLLQPNIYSPADTTLEHRSETGIAGCYAVTAIDSFNNESAFSNIFCVDNCPVYELPNVFTPNSDGQNDFFIPFPYRFVESVDFKVFNRWGQLVFETQDPNINWDGNNESGSELSEGTYFYTCTVFEQRLEGVTQSPVLLKGFIELIRGER